MKVLKTLMKKLKVEELLLDDAFFQPDWAAACWGHWAGPELMLGWSAGSGCGSSLQKEQERRRAGRGFARSGSDA